MCPPRGTQAEWEAIRRTFAYREPPLREQLFIGGQGLPPCEQKRMMMGVTVTDVIERDLVVDLAQRVEMTAEAEGPELAQPASNNPFWDLLRRREARRRAVDVPVSDHGIDGATPLGPIEESWGDLVNDAEWSTQNRRINDLLEDRS